MTWLLANARIRGRTDPVDLLVKPDGLRVLPRGQSLSADWQHWDLDGRVVLPGLVELHAHIDKTYSDSRNPAGTLRGAIERFVAHAEGRSLDEIEARAERALRAAIAHGVTRLRSHLDFSRPRDLQVLEVMAGLRRRYARCMDIQFVAMIGGLGDPEKLRLLETGVRMGIDLIGGAPALSSDPGSGIRELLSVAVRLERGLDIHVDEHDHAGSPALQALLETRDLRAVPGHLTASHCCSLAFMRPDERDLLLRRMADSGVSLVTLPACNLVLMGRDAWPVPRGSAPIAAARAAGMLVGVGSDNVQDPFNPFGDYDPLQSARLAALVGHLGMDGELGSVVDLVTRDAARIFGGPPAVIADGMPADLVVTDCRDVDEVIAHPPARLATFKNGAVVVRTSIAQEWVPLYSVSG